MTGDMQHDQSPYAASKRVYYDCTGMGVSP
jgi:hypothetical protein